MTEFRVSRLGTLSLFLLTAIGATGFASIAALAWENILVGGGMLAGALFCGGVALALVYRLIARPVMVRVGDDGIYLKRLDVVVPWEALQLVERFEFKGKPAVAFVERESGHPIFREGKVALGASANALIGLPPLCDTFSGIEGGIDGFLGAVETLGRVPVSKRDER